MEYDHFWQHIMHYMIDGVTSHKPTQQTTLLNALALELNAWYNVQ